MPNVNKINGHFITVVENATPEFKNVVLEGSSSNLIYKGTGEVLPGKKWMHCIRLYKTNTIAITIQMYSKTNENIYNASRLKSFLDSVFGTSTVSRTLYLHVSGNYYVSSSVGWRPVVSANYNNRSDILNVSYSNSRTSYTISTASFTLSTSGLLIADSVTPFNL